LIGYLNGEFRREEPGDGIVECG